MNGNKIFFSCFVLVFGGLILFICYLIVNKDYLFKKHEYSYTKDEYFDLTDYTIEVTDVALITSITQGRNVYKADVLSMNVKRMCQNSPTFTVAYNEGEKKILFMNYMENMDQQGDTLLLVYNKEHKEIRVKSTMKVVSSMGQIYYFAGKKIKKICQNGYVFF